MTMLDRMRRHKNWLKWSLILVCLAFVVFYIPDFLAPPTTDLAATDAVAVVAGEEITGAEFRRAYVAQMNAYRAAGGGMSDQVLRQLGVDQQVLQQMVDERAALAEANRLGIEVLDEEVRQRILTLPALQQNGVFIGEAAYMQLLASQNPPVSPREFEESMRRAIMVDKLRAMVTDWISVSDADVEREFRRSNERVRLAVAPFTVDSFRPDVGATDEEVAAYYTANNDEFRVGERRKIRYVFVDAEAIREKTVVSDADIERAYNDNFEQYTEPDQVRASHILLRTEGQDAAAVRAQAEDLLKQARSGVDFAQLAQKFSQDEASAANGGDLNFFTRGTMVPAFDTAAFGLEVGQISDIVETDFGLHIIKVTERRPGASRSLDEVRSELTEQLTLERAREEAANLADRLGSQATTADTLNSVAASNGLEVVESDFFERDGVIGGIGPAPALTARAFEISGNEVTGIVPVVRGFVIASLAEREDPYLPELDAIREEVRAAVLTSKAKAMATARAAALAPRLKEAADFVAAAKAGGVEAETTDLLTRDAPVPQLGAAPKLMAAAFGMSVNAVSDPIETDAGVAIVKVLEKDDVTPDELSSGRDTLREQLLADRRNRFFTSYMNNVKENLQIEINREAMRLIVG
ncbi:MAG: peptidyl-prolyl cis-trans isomerase [Vicinamibacterales bacterium]